jgi:hypothetical protein
MLGVLLEGEIPGCTKRVGRLSQSLQCNRRVRRRKQAINGGTAGFHSVGHPYLGEPFRLSQFIYLVGDDAFQRDEFGSIEQPFFCQEVIEFASEMWVSLHHVPTPALYQSVVFSSAPETDPVIAHWLSTRIGAVEDHLDALSSHGKCTKYDTYINYPISAWLPRHN